VSNILINDFGAGEISPKYEGRINIPDYVRGCRTLQNMIPMTSGGVTKRPGSYYVATGKTLGKKVRLVPFEFSDTQAYILEFGVSYIRVYKDQGAVYFFLLTIDAGPAPADWAAAATITGGSSSETCKVVSKIDSTHYVCKALTGEFDDGEILSDGTNSRDCGAGYPTYDYDYTPCEITTTYTEDELPELQFVQSADTLYIVHPAHAPATLTRTGHDVWTLAGISITQGGGDDDLEAADYRPSCMAFLDERLIVAGSNNKPQSLYGSVVADWDNYTIGTTSADAFKYTIAAKKVNRILWLAGHDQLLFGTMGGEWRAADLAPDALPIIRQQSTFGSKNLQALTLNEGVIFVTRNGRRVRYMSYDYQTDGYRSPDLTKLAEHITGTGAGIVSWDYQQDPDSTLWAVRDDGVLLSFSLDVDYNVRAWARHITDGAVESVAVISGTSEDEVWISVKRTIEDVEYRYIEYLKPRDWGTSQKDYFFVDSGLTYDGKVSETITEITKSATCTITFAATTAFANDDLIRISGVTDMTEVNGKVYMLKNKATNTFDLYTADGGAQIDSSGFTLVADDGSAEEVVKTVSNLSYLNGKEVDVCADGAKKAPKTVASGSITLDNYANTVHVGLNYVSQVKPMKMGLPITKRIHHLTLRLYKSLGGQFGPDADNLEYFDYRKLGDPMDTAPGLVSDDKEVSFDGGYEKSGTILIHHADPLPFSVLMIMAEMGQSQV